MKRSLTLRTQLSILLALIVLLQSLALSMALSISKVFSMLDSEAVRLLSNTTETRAQTLNTALGRIVNDVAVETKQLSDRFITLAKDSKSQLDRLYRDDAAYDSATLIASESLISLLQSSSITGAFVILNGSNSNKEEDSAHSAIYIRNSAPESTANDTGNYLLEIGSTSVSRQYQIATSIHWNLDIRFDEDMAEFYAKPIWASTQFKRAEMERYGYWSVPNDMLGDNQQVICYTMPLLDEEGLGYGVVGIEISVTHFMQNYLPASDMLYQNSFYAITSIQDSMLSFDWFIPGGVLAQVYLKKGMPLPLGDASGNGAELYQTNLEGLGPMYCSLRPLTVYSDNSPFVDQNWSLVCFVPQTALHEGSASVRQTLVGSLLATAVSAFLAVFVLVYFFTRKISGLSKYVSNLSPYDDIQFRKTGMREIDDLTSAVAMLNQSVITASKATSQILEMTLLPIGGFEISSESKHVVLTEYLYKLLHIEPGVSVSKEEWNQYYVALTRQPMDEYENVYQYYNAQTEGSLWLRILRTETEEGIIGVILDVTKDIEENRRLAHELDYDGFTHLYNRVAFKREVNWKIREAPDQIGVMIFSDLDNLKYINDTFGHDMGDRLIIRASELFREFTLHKGVVSRISGDEFAIYLHGFESKEQAWEVIRNQFRHNDSFRLLTPDGESRQIRFSSGLAWYPDDSDNVTDLLKLSDFAMYEAKHKDKGSLYEFSKESYQETSYLLENREAINRLLDEGLIRFAYQPIIDLKTGQVYAYEALMRPMLDNFRNPMEVLAVASAQSKLGQLERLAILTAFQGIDEHRRELGDAYVFINSIPSQMLSDEDHELLRKKYQHLFKGVVVEITEAENNLPEKLAEKAKFIRDNGMRLAVDDFGSGYSNEIRILNIMPDIVKVDMEMIQGIHYDQDKQNLVTNLVEFCHKRGTLLIGEGVEDTRDLAALVHMGVDYAQGFYTGRPAFGFTAIDPKIKQEILSLQNQP